MGKNKKRKLLSRNVAVNTSELSGQEKESGVHDGPHANEDEVTVIVNCTNNPLYRKQQLFLSSLTPQQRDFYFSSLSSCAITPDQRAKIWMEQADIGEGLVNRYAWATPTKECLLIFREFSPIVEIGSGSNAYWAKYMMEVAGIDVVAYDMNLQKGGKIRSKATVRAKEMKYRLKKSDDELSDYIDDSSELVLRKGGPEVLKLSELRNRTLFLCYPDEEDSSVQGDNKHISNSREEDNMRPLSFGWECLNEYKGTHVIHVGELAVLGDATLNMEQSPWGRSSSSEFQQRLASEFHCIAKIQLPNWLHVRDSISVWKRSEVCQMVFEGDDDEEDEEDEIIEYRHIPPAEMLPRSIIAPCMAHLLSPALPAEKATSTAKSRLFEMAASIRKNTNKTSEKRKIEKKNVSAGEETFSKKSKTDLRAKDDRDHEVETNAEMLSKKTKRGRRRERQKQKKHHVDAALLIS